MAAPAYIPRFTSSWRLAQSLPSTPDHPDQDVSRRQNDACRLLALCPLDRRLCPLSAASREDGESPSHPPSSVPANTRRPCTPASCEIWNSSGSSASGRRTLRCRGSWRTSTERCRRFKAVRPRHSLHTQMPFHDSSNSAPTQMALRLQQLCSTPAVAASLDCRAPHLADAASSVDISMKDRRTWSFIIPSFACITCLHLACITCPYTVHHRTDTPERCVNIRHHRTDTPERCVNIREAMFMDASS
jgi:hypothetical protein